MKNCLVSIIIACYNGELYIDECLESLVHLNYKNIEIIVCDDASTDNSYLLLQKWQIKDNRIRLLHNTKNLYSAAARNSCINISNGDYIMIQDIDDISLPNRIDLLLSSLIANDVDFISSSMATINDIGEIDYDHLLKHKARPTKFDFLWNLPFNHPATLLKAEVIKKVNGYKVIKETRRAQDYDMFMRLYAKKAKGMNISEPLYLYRLDAANYKRRTFLARIDECKIRYNGFKELNILSVGFPMVLKPLIVYLVRKIFQIK